jgi:putative ATP-dependent endonuclease of OLD family
MHLGSIQIENYRAIRRAAISLDPTTVLIGENDCGRTSVLEALMLILGGPDERFETRLRPFHFHSSTGESTGPLCIRLRFRLDASTTDIPPELGRLDNKNFEFEFRAQLEAGAIRTQCLVSRSGAPPLKVGPRVLDWIRSQCPALWLRSGAAMPSQPATVAKSSSVRKLQQHFQNLVTGETPDLAAELERATMAALDVVQSYPKAFAGTVPVISAIATDILNRNRLTQSGAEPRTITSANKLGLVLLLGSILQITSRQIAPGGRPLLVIENPETNLHPTTLASMWRVIERLQWQKLISTNSTSVLANVPLGSIRRLTRNEGLVTEWFAPPRFLPRDDLRRVSYHVRSRRAAAMFARCWVLGEGETEFWLIPELARICGHDFAAEGIACVEYAQCGVEPLIKLADRLGIAWHVMADGDDAGQHYSAQAKKFNAGSRLTILRQRDMEHCFWDHGFDDVIREVAHASGAPRSTPSAWIRKAIMKTSKPYLALRLVDAAADRGPSSVPAPLRQVIESAVRLARIPPDPRQA